jgi:hypothetical protein
MATFYGFSIHPALGYDQANALNNNMLFGYCQSAEDDLSLNKTLGHRVNDTDPDYPHITRGILSKGDGNLVCQLIGDTSNRTIPLVANQSLPLAIKFIDSSSSVTNGGIVLFF